MTDTAALSLFAGYGVEIEMMIVDSATLSVQPIADEVLKTAAGNCENEVVHGEACWSNELVSHVIEVKTNGPSGSLDGLSDLFQHQVDSINARLSPFSCRLMPTAMHPWMDPHLETHLWPYENNEIYEAYNRIFGCQGHGWANLQSVHLNLPFADDEEFARLHAAIRLVLPLLPALAASSPIMDGRTTGLLDNRLEVYRKNQVKFPSVAGRVIPEPVFTRADYEVRILGEMYREISQEDPEGVLCYEWLNSRGAIARFGRSTIEIRVLDTQECPRADLAVVKAATAVIRALVEERWADLERQKAIPIDPLEEVFLAAVEKGDEAVIDDREYLKVLGFVGRESCATGDVWRHFAEALYVADGTNGVAGRNPLAVILEQGCLSRRILAALAGDIRRERLAEVYGELCDCLSKDKVFAV
jgi:gamma-glutamyl:cysteine ligase YbdK (ATP-grasp superfamily)